MYDFCVLVILFSCLAQCYVFTICRRVSFTSGCLMEIFQRCYKNFLFLTWRWIFFSLNDLFGVSCQPPSHSATGWSICDTKEKILIIGFSSNLDDYLRPKPPILWIFDYFFIKMVKMVICLKSLKFSKIFPLFKCRKLNIL